MVMGVRVGGLCLYVARDFSRRAGVAPMSRHGDYIPNAHQSPGDPLRVLYFIGSYGPEVMGNASHEQTVQVDGSYHLICARFQSILPIAPQDLTFLRSLRSAVFADR